MPLFYSVQSRRDAVRLSTGGDPWPTGLQRANLGVGFYGWDSREVAEAYRQALEARGATDLLIVVYQASQDDLDGMRTLDLTQGTDVEVEAWMAKHSHYGEGKPHDWEYVIRNTGKGTEHYVAAAVFARLREVG